jgi:hypothetical protein
VLFFGAPRTVAGLFLAGIEELVPTFGAQDSISHTLHKGLVELTRAGKTKGCGMTHEHILKDFGYQGVCSIRLLVSLDEARW